MTCEDPYTFGINCAILNASTESENKETEEPTVKASYDSFTGELVKLERCKVNAPGFAGPVKTKTFYNLEIYDAEKQVTHSFTHIKLDGVKFLGGAVTFGQ